MTKFTPALIGMLFLGSVLIAFIQQPQPDLIAELIERTIDTKPHGLHV